MVDEKGPPGAQAHRHDVAVLACAGGVEAELIPLEVGEEFPERGCRVVYLDHEHEQAVVAALPETFRPYFVVAVHTGLRWSEQMRLRWQDVDLLGGFITVRTSKNYTGRTVPVNSLARSAFVEQGSRRRRPDDPEEHVFDPRPVQPAFVAKPVERAVAMLKMAGKDTTMMVGFTWHGCRHTFASRLVMASVNLMTIKELGGWKTLAMVQRYAHLAPHHLHAAVERLVPGVGQGAGPAASSGTEVSRKYDSPHVADLNGSKSASRTTQEVPGR